MAFLSINPTKAKSLVESLCIRHSGHARVFFVDAQQDSVRSAMVFRKPGPEITRRREAHCFHICLAFTSTKAARILS